MIVIKKPFIYLKEHNDFGYCKYHNKNWENVFMDPARIMMFERRDAMTCKLFQTFENVTTKDAEYIAITLNDFLYHSNINEDYLFCQYNTNCSWLWEYIKLGLKVIQNAEIGMPTKETFPLIIRNNKYNFYIACKLEMA